MLFDVGVVWVVFIEKGLVDEVFAKVLKGIFCAVEGCVFVSFDTRLVFQ